MYKVLILCVKTWITRGFQTEHNLPTFFSVFTFTACSFRHKPHTFNNKHRITNAMKQLHC